MEEILHKGKIVDITPTTTTVEIISESACASCHAKGLCGMGESKVKLVEVPTSGWDKHFPGEEVQLALKRSMGFKAVWIAYVLPLVVLLAVLLVMVGLGFSELASGLWALAAVGLYYLCVWLLRNKLSNEYSFYIR